MLQILPETPRARAATSESETPAPAPSLPCRCPTCVCGSSAPVFRSAWAGGEQQRSPLDVNESGDSAPSERRPSVELRKKAPFRGGSRSSLRRHPGVEQMGFLKQRQKYQLFRFRSDPALDPPTQRYYAADCERRIFSLFFCCRFFSAERASACARRVELDGILPFGFARVGHRCDATFTC